MPRTQQNRRRKNRKSGNRLVDQPGRERLAADPAGFYNKFFLPRHRMNVYELILSRATLSPEHKDELIKKRGFSEETIKKLRFVSGGQYLLEVEPILTEKYTAIELLNSGTCVDNDNKLSISPILLENRIIIPYLNKKEQCYMLRPHKLGLKGVEVQVYHDMAIGDNLIITEGEFKAAACYQMGINAVAVPGISSFSDKHFPKLVKLLNDEKVKSICIIFDNEVKDDPAFPKRFKVDPMKRHDTQFYAYYMAKILEKEGFDCRIGTLPDGWRVDGKIDIDGAMAQGRTKKDILHVIQESKTHRRFMEDMAEESKTVINRKMAHKYFRSHVRREFNRYIATRHRGRHDIDEVISNFVVEIIATHDTPEGIMREVRFINQFHERSSSFVISADEMASRDTFKSFCLSKGNFIWSGRGEDMDVIWEQEFLNDTGLRIFEPDHVGWVESENTWLFGNVAFKDGKEYRADDSHIFWIGKKGVKPLGLSVSTGKNLMSEGLPWLNIHPFDKELLRKNLIGSIGEREAKIALGWCGAVAFLEEIFEQYNCFPFLFITGKRGTGKSTVGEWLMNFYGLENCGKMASDTTPVAIQRYMSYYSSLPLLIDEYRNTKNVVYKNGMLRNAYNRQSAGKGIKSDFGVREGKIRGTLLLCGEETPEDNALLSRCVCIMVSNQKRVENNFSWFMANRIRFSYIFYDLIKRKAEMVEPFIKVVEKAKGLLIGKGMDDRNSINYAIVAAGYSALFDDDGSIVNHVVAEAGKTMQVNDAEQPIKVFIDDLIYLKTIKKVNKDFWDVSDNHAHFYFHGLFNAWAEHYRKVRAVEAFKQSTMCEYLKEEPGFVDSRFNKRINGDIKSCMRFNYEKMTQEMKVLVSDKDQTTSSSEPQEGWQE